MANTNCFFAFCSLHPAVSIQLLLRCGESMDGASQRGGRAPRGRTAAYLCPPPVVRKIISALSTLPVYSHNGKFM